MSVYNIPQAMRERRQWMVASADKRPMTRGWHGETDVIYGQKNNPDHWLSFDEAVYLGSQNGYRIGYVNSPDDPFTIIDLDNINNANPVKSVHDSETQAIQQYFIDEAVRHGWYMEASQSGTGAHIVVEGKLSRDTNAKGIEFYGNNGFVVMTGKYATGAIRRMSDSHVDSCNQLIDLRGAKELAGSMQYTDEFLERLAAPYSSYEQDECRSILEKLFKFNIRYVDMEAGTDVLPNGNQVDGKGNERDLDFMQGIYKVLKDHPNRDLMALRVFQQTERWLKRKAKKNWQYVLNETFPKMRAICHREEQQANEWMQAANDFKNQQTAPAPQLATLNAPVSMPPIGLVPTPKFVFQKATEVANEEPPRWAIDDVFMEQSVNAMYGWSAVGKSFVAIDMILAVADGRKWVDRVTKRMPVSYMALEGGEGFGQRLRAAALGKRIQLPDNIEIYRGRFNLADSEQVAALIEARKKVGAMGGMLVIDTLSKASMSINENDNADMAKLVVNAERIKEELQACVVILHHSTKPDPKTGTPGMMRGGGALQAGIDGVVAVCRRHAREEKDMHTGEIVMLPERRFIELEKIKEGKDSAQYEFSLCVEEVGETTRPDGSAKKIESCWISWAGEQNSRVAPNVGNGGMNGPVGGSTYSTADRATMGFDPTRPPPVQLGGARGNRNVKSGRQANEQRAARYDIAAVIEQALKVGADRVAHGNRGKFGAQPNSDPTPKEELVTIIADLVNPDEVDSAFKTAVKNALNYAVNSGKLGRSTEHGKTYYWLRE